MSWLLLLLGGPAAAEEAFTWPLSLDPALSSTFGETRPTAFHAGIDLKTQGRTGHEVRAVAAGHAWRVRTSPWGYGRALYQKTADGRIVVYAHLENFAPPIAARVAQAQQEKQAYTVDLELKPEEIPLARGQLIAWSGQSGIGPPHLHLELRDADNVPINPLLHGFAVKDTAPPVIQRLALTPLDIESTAAGGHLPVSMALRRKGAYYQADEPLIVQGRLGLSALLHDLADAAPNHLAPCRTRVLVDGRPLFSATYDRVSYTDAHQVLLDRAWLDFPGGGGVFFNLFRLPGNRLEFYELAPGADGLLCCGPGAGENALEQGRHEVVVEAADAAGNTARARLSLQVDALPHILNFRLRSGGEIAEAQVEDRDGDSLETQLDWSADGRRWERVDSRRLEPGSFATQLPQREGLWRLRVRDPAGGEDFKTCAFPEPGAAQLDLQPQIYPGFADLAIRVDQALAAAPVVEVEDSRRRQQLVPRQLGLLDYQVAVPFQAEGGALILRVMGHGSAPLTLLQEQVRPDQEARVVYGGGQAILHFPAGSAYAPLFPQAAPFAPAAAEGLSSVGVGYAFSPERTSFDQQIGVFLRYPEGAVPEKLGLYQDRGNGKWSFAGNELDAPHRLVGARVRRLLRYALFLDTQSPRIDSLQPAQGAVLRERQPALRAQVADAGSGIGREEDLAVKLDGRRLISEYDPEAGTVSCQPTALAPGRHTLVVEARDQSGNQASAQAEFTVE